jgi:hypothetical protein
MVVVDFCIDSSGREKRKQECDCKLHETSIWHQEPACRAKGKIW